MTLISTDFKQPNSHQQICLTISFTALVACQFKSMVLRYWTKSARRCCLTSFMTQGSIYCREKRERSKSTLELMGSAHLQLWSRVPFLSDFLFVYGHSIALSKPIMMRQSPLPENYKQ